MRSKLVIVMLIAGFVGWAQQWSPIPNPPYPQWAGQQFYFPKNMTPIADGKIAFSSYNIVSPSSGNYTYLYLSYNENLSYTSCWSGHDGGIGNPGGTKEVTMLRSFNDSCISFLSQAMAGSYPKLIYYTVGNFKPGSVRSLYPLGQQSFTIRSHVVTGSFKYALTVIPGDSLKLLKGLASSSLSSMTSMNSFALPTTPNVYRSNELLDFVNDSVGFVLANYKSNLNKATLLKTNDYGYTWTSIHVDSVQGINRFHFPSKDVGYLTKGNGVVLKTIDGGTNWSVISSPPTISITCIKFENDNRGYCGGTNGQLWKTTDGGNTWGTELTNCTNNIEVIYAFKNDVAYFTDNTGKVYKNVPDAGTKESEWIDSDISLYPNPANDRIILDLSNLKEPIRSIKLMNVTGVILQDIKQKNLSQKQYFISVAELPIGMYFVTIESEGKLFTRKISVVH